MSHRVGGLKSDGYYLNDPLGLRLGDNLIDTFISLKVHYTILYSLIILIAE